MFIYNNIDIEKYISELKGRIYTKKVSVVLYDINLHGYHLISMIRRNTDECLMMTLYGKELKYMEFSLPFISQLNQYYGYCEIVEDSSFIGMNYEDIKEGRSY